MRNVLFIKYNTLRRPEYQISTTIYEEHGERFVEKAPCTRAAEAHVERLETNYRLLMQAHANVEAEKPDIRNHVATYEYIPGKTLEEELQEEFDDVEVLIQKVRENLCYIYTYRPEYQENFVCTEAFCRVFGGSFAAGDEGWRMLEGRSAVRIADIDLVFDNIIKKNGKWVLLDYEWVFNFPVPVDFLKFRTAAYFYDRHNLYFSGKYTRAAYFEKLGFDPEDIGCFDRMEEKFQEFVRGEDQKYHCLKAYEKKIIPFRAYETYATELEQRDSSIRFLNEVIASKEEYIVSMEQLIQKYHSNPAYILMNRARNLLRKLNPGRKKQTLGILTEEFHDEK